MSEGPFGFEAEQERRSGEERRMSGSGRSGQDRRRTDRRSGFRTADSDRRSGAERRGSERRSGLDRRVVRESGAGVWQLPGR